MSPNIWSFSSISQFKCYSFLLLLFACFWLNLFYPTYIKTLYNVWSYLSISLSSLTNILCWILSKIYRLPELHSILLLYITFHRVVAHQNHLFSLTCNLILMDSLPNLPAQAYLPGLKKHYSIPKFHETSTFRFHTLIQQYGTFLSTHSIFQLKQLSPVSPRMPLMPGSRSSFKPLVFHCVYGSCFSYGFFSYWLLLRPFPFLCSCDECCNELGGNMSCQHYITSFSIEMARSCCYFCA